MTDMLDNDNNETSAPEPNGLIIARPENVTDEVMLVDPENGNATVCFVSAPGIALASDIDILTHVYLKSLFMRDAPEPDNLYKERLRGMIMATLHAQHGRDDFTAEEWAMARYELTANVNGIDLYVNVRTMDGYDLIIMFMVAGGAWQTVNVSYDELVPTPNDLYALLQKSTEVEWDNKGSVSFDGFTYEYAMSSRNMFSSKSKLSITNSKGETLYSNESSLQAGFINSLLELHRSMLLKLNYGPLGELPEPSLVELRINLHGLMVDLFGMGEYAMLVDGLTASTRAEVDIDVECLVTHTYIEPTQRMSYNFRFFTMHNSWSTELTQEVNIDEPAPHAFDIYNGNISHIRVSLGYDPVPEFNQDEAIAADVPISMIVAVGPKNGIGMGNELLFRIKEDLQYFKRVTTGNVVIMGRKTFESIGIPLPNRFNIIVTTDPEYIINQAAAFTEEQQAAMACVTSPEEALLLAKVMDAKLVQETGKAPGVFVIGGGTLYETFLGGASTIHMTVINSDDSHADVFFPLSTDDVQKDWDVVVLNEELVAEDETTYARYLLTRK